MIQEVIEEIEREIEIRKNMPHNHEQVDICYGLNQAKEIAKKVLKESGNDPLTQQELQALAGKPVYCQEIESYGIVKCETIGIWTGVPFLVGAWHCNGGAVNFEYNIMKRGLKCYRTNSDWEV